LASARIQRGPDFPSLFLEGDAVLQQDASWPAVVQHEAAFGSASVL
jgi:hypothetical protein